jgi:DNA (cytosine-5)-methyltransferase 1
MKHFDLFSGYGGFTIALERAGIKTVGFSEIDKHASSILKYHWPKIKNHGDIAKIKTEELPNFDILTGGSPCQDLSIAGKRKGLAGERSGLFKEFIRILRAKKPKYFVWENVKGALSSEAGWDFAEVINQMAESGYNLWWQVLNAKDFGVPQNRERIFVVGFRKECSREIFFNKRDEKKGNAVYAIGTKNRQGNGNYLREITKKASQGYRVYDTKGIATTIASQAGGGRGKDRPLYGSERKRKE